MVPVDHGQGFTLAVGAGLQAGDRVFIGERSSAIVAYAGCMVKLDKPTVFVVGKTAPCALNADTVQVGSVFISPALDVPPVGGGAGAGATGAGTAGAGSGVLGSLAGLGPLLILPPAIIVGTFFIATASKN